MRPLTAPLFLLFTLLISSVPVLAQSQPDSLSDLNVDGLSAFKSGDYGRSEGIFKTALEKAYASDDKQWVGTLLSNLSAVYAAEGKKEESERTAMEADAVKNKLAGRTAAADQPSFIPGGSAPRTVRQQVPLNGYVEDSDYLKNAIARRSSVLRSQAGLYDSSVKSAKTRTATAAGAADFDDWPPAFPPPMSTEPPEFQQPPPIARHMPPPHCDPCRDQMLGIIRVMGLGIFGAPGPGGPGFGPPRRLFDYSIPFDLNNP